MNPGPFGLMLAMGLSCLTARVAWAQSDQLDTEPIVARVDWLAEVLKGGATSVALVALAMIGVALIIERFIRIRPAYFASPPLAAALDRLIENPEDVEALQTIQGNPSILGQSLQAIVDRADEPESVRREVAEDLLRRRVRSELARTSLLAVVAGLAPLLGLLGTMIGMIEAFKLVEVYGDEGGASMLAGSISKALITTALGLVIAIIALAAYHGLRLRITLLAARVETETDRFMRLAAQHRSSLSGLHAPGSIHASPTS